MEKTMKARIQHKHDIEANWLKATNFIPLASEIIVYDPDENYDYPRIKIGDGKTNINALPFVTKDYAKIAVQPETPTDTSVLWIDPNDNTMDETPNGGNVDLSITGATVGQTVKISAVDENGAPTAWEAVDFHNEGEFELIETVELAEVSTLILDNLNLKRILVYFTIPAEATFDDGAYKYFNTLFYRGSTRRIVYTPIEDKAAIRRGFVEAEVIGKQVKATTVNNVGSTSHLTIQCTVDSANYSIESDADVFTKIHINSKIPKGTKIDIYGVRA